MTMLMLVNTHLPERLVLSPLVHLISETQKPRFQTGDNVLMCLHQERLSKVLSSTPIRPRCQALPWLVLILLDC